MPSLHRSLVRRSHLDKSSFMMSVQMQHNLVSCVQFDRSNDAIGLNPQ